MTHQTISPQSLFSAHTKRVETDMMLAGSALRSVRFPHKNFMIPPITSPHNHPTTQLSRRSTKQSRLNCCGRGLGGHDAMLKWPPSNTLTASTIYDAGTQPSAGKAPWFLKKGCLSEQTERHQTVTGPGDRRKTRNGSVSGLGLRVTAHGAKSFVHSFRFNGKHRRSVIGCPDTMNVTSARFMVLQRNNDIAAGIDPDENMKTDYRKKYGETLGDVIDAYFEQHLPSKAPSHHAEFSRLIAPWTRATPKNRNRGAKRSTRLTLGEMYRDTLVADLTPQHIGPYLQRISADSIANNTLRQLRALFNWVIRMQIVDMRNPCSPFQMRKMIKQRRDYTPEQVKEIARHVFNPPMRQVVSLEGLSGREKQVAALKAGHATQNHDQLVELCNYMGILFLTMARPIEVKTARFEHFDLDRLIWHKHNTKGIKLSRSTYEYAFRSVPIHPKVAELVRHQRARWPESDLLFPNHADQMQPRDNFQRAIKRFKQLDGVPSHFQLYDLKRMAISMMMVGQGVRREDVSHYVDHRGNLDTTLIYDLGFVDPLRPVTQKLGEVLGV